jgi:hypothetical protein
LHKTVDCDKVLGRRLVGCGDHGCVVECFQPSAWPQLCELRAWQRAAKGTSAFELRSAASNLPRRDFLTEISW